MATSSFTKKFELLNSKKAKNSFSAILQKPPVEFKLNPKYETETNEEKVKKEQELLALLASL